MKRFQFAFERVLEWRDLRAEMERTELQRLRDASTTLAGTRVRIQAEIDEAGSAARSGNLRNGSDFHRMAEYVQALRLQERNVRTKQNECQAAIVKQTDTCVTADRDHKLLVRLRERNLASWQAELAREAEHAATESWQAGRARLVKNARTRKQSAEE